jgi:hypothetical protein
LSDLVAQLFGLEELALGDEGVRFAFARGIPAWGWATALAVGAAFAGWSYWKLLGSRAGRVALACVRVATLMLLLAVILGPQLVRSNDRIERDWVVVLVDRSASMTVQDTGDERASREAQLTAAVRDAWPMFSTLVLDRNVLWLGFDAGAFDLEAADESLGASFGIDLGEPSGQRTSLGAALDQALRRVAARPVSGVVLLTDGRSADAPSRDAVRRLQNELIPVFAVPLGSPEPITDLALRGADAPRVAFVDDVVPVAVDIERLGSGATGATVTLVDETTGDVLDERRVEPSELETGSARITLSSKPDTPGEVRWVVRIEPDVPDLIAENNSAKVALELLDETLRVAYFDGYPRWEFRYVKNLLLREGSIDSSALMLSSNKRYIQEGDTTLNTLPRSPEEWADFDVIVLGDLRAEMFSEEQLEQIRELVSVRGAGLLWIAGPSATPASWRGTALADLLPFRSGRSSSESLRAWDEPVAMAPTPAAERSGLLRTAEQGERGEVDGWQTRLSDPLTGWSQLRWAQRIDPSVVKPTAEVLAVAAPASQGVAGVDSPDAAPVVLSMRFGAGKVVYVGTDEIWRWRYGRGEQLPERFWIPLIRHLGRESLSRSDQSAVLEISPRRALVDQPVRVRVGLLDQAIVDAAPKSITVTIEPVAGGDGSPTQLVLGPERAAEADRVDSFVSTWVPGEPGRYAVRVNDPLLAGMGLAAALEVSLSEDELRNPETDHVLLAMLAEQTDGRVLEASALSELSDFLPNRERVIPTAPDIETLWDRPIVLIVFLVLLTVEWVGRRLIRLS